MPYEDVAWFHWSRMPGHTHRDIAVNRQLDRFPVKCFCFAACCYLLDNRAYQLWLETVFVIGLLEHVKTLFTKIWQVLILEEISVEVVEQFLNKLREHGEVAPALDESLKEVFLILICIRKRGQVFFDVLVYNLFEIVVCLLVVIPLITLVDHFAVNWDKLFVWYDLLLLFPEIF